MKPGDLVKIITDRGEKLENAMGLIVELEMLINDRQMWQVMVYGDIHNIRENDLELVNEAR